MQTFLCWKPPRTALFYKQERDGGRRRGFAPYCIKPFHLHHTVPYHSILLHHTMQNHTNTSPKCTIMHHITPHHKLLSNAHHTSPKCTVPCSVAEKRVGWQKRARGADGHLCQDWSRPTLSPTSFSSPTVLPQSSSVTILWVVEADENGDLLLNCVIIGGVLLVPWLFIWRRYEVACPVRNPGSY